MFNKVVHYVLPGDSILNLNCGPGHTLPGTERIGFLIVSGDPEKTFVTTVF